MVVVVVLPLLKLVIEDLSVVDDGPVQEPVKLLGIDAVRSLHLAVEARRPGFDVPVANPFVEHVVVE
jgi:hypothetical protein